MSSNVLEALKNLRSNLHNVGSLNNWGKTVLNQGAIAKEKMDNFTLVTLGFDANGEREASLLTDNTKKGYLVASPEEYMREYESISSFFNGQGERVRIVTLESGVRFECSNVDFQQKTGNAPASGHPLKNGQHAHYDHTSKKFIISNNTAANPSGGTGMHNEYQNAANKVVLVDKDCTSIDGQTVYRFEVI
mgnify:CR=1 FL=1